MRPVSIDTNLLLLFLVGSTSKKYIAIHKRLTAYSIADFEILVDIIGRFSEIVVVAHTLAETSNLIRHMRNPFKAAILEKMRLFVNATREIPVSSASGGRSLGSTAAGCSAVVLCGGAGGLSMSLRMPTRMKHYRGASNLQQETSAAPALFRFVGYDSPPCDRRPTPPRFNPSPRNGPHARLQVPRKHRGSRHAPVRRHPARCWAARTRSRVRGRRTRL